MKANFGYIEQAYVQRLERELANPTIPATALTDEPDNIAGFLVKDEERTAIRRAQLTNVYVDHIKNFHADREALRTELQMHGVEPLAIVPATGWQYLCALGGLVQLHPRADGAIGVSARRLDRIEVQATWLKWLSFVALTGVVCGVFVSYAPNHTAATITSADAWYVAAMMSAGVAALVAWAVLLMFPDLGKTGFVRLLLKLYDRAPARVIINDFFPNQRRAEPDDTITAPGTRQRMLRAQLVFPEPPAEVAAVLLKARHLDLHVAAAPEAIGFTQAPSAILRAEMTERTRARRAARAADPVIYVREGSAVAILAQYGEFPIEQEIVDLAVESRYLL